MKHEFNTATEINTTQRDGNTHRTARRQEHDRIAVAEPARKQLDDAAEHRELSSEDGKHGAPHVGPTTAAISIRALRAWR